MDKNNLKYLDDGTVGFVSDNELIAEFMGGQRVLPDKDVYNMPTHNNLCYEVNELQYDTSWDWLMPVVESCFERLDARDTSADEIKRQLLVCNLRGVHTVVVEFIKEYNNVK